MIIYSFSSSKRIFSIENRSYKNILRSSLGQIKNRSECVLVAKNCRIRSLVIESPTTVQRIKLITFKCKFQLPLMQHILKSKYNIILVTCPVSDVIKIFRGKIIFGAIFTFYNRLAVAQKNLRITYIIPECFMIKLKSRRVQELPKAESCRNGISSHFVLIVEKSGNISRRPSKSIIWRKTEQNGSKRR